MASVLRAPARRLAMLARGRELGPAAAHSLASARRSFSSRASASADDAQFWPKTIFYGGLSLILGRFTKTCLDLREAKMEAESERLKALSREQDVEIARLERELAAWEKENSF